MALKKSDTIFEFCDDKYYRCDLLRESIIGFLNCDFDFAKSTLNDYLIGTSSYDKITTKLNLKEQSIRRMLSEKGNPTSKNLFLIINFCLQQEEVEDMYRFLSVDD